MPSRTPILANVAALVAALAASARFAPAYAAELSLPRSAAAPGASLLLPVGFASQPGSLTGLQFDLQYDSSSLSLSATMGDAARASGKSLYLFDASPGLKRFVLAGLNRNPIVEGALVNLFVSASPAAAAGTYPLTFSAVIGTDGSGQPVNVTAADGAVTIAGAAGTGPRLLAAGVVNAASLLPGPVAPGEIVTLLGAGIGPSPPQAPADSATATVLGGAAVWFDGLPAPLLYASPHQVNVIVPFGVYRKTATQLRVTQNGQTAAELPLPVADAAPAIFTGDGTGAGQGAILNQDGTFNSPFNPAPRGSTVTFFAAGAGQTDPPGTDGQIAAGPLAKPLLPVSVKIGGVDATVAYAGAAPGLVAGVLQVNCVVPADSPVGIAVPVTLVIGNYSSQPGLTVVIQ